MTHPTQTADLADLRRQLDTETAARQIAETTAANALDLIPAEILMDLIADRAEASAEIAEIAARDAKSRAARG